MSQEKSKHSKKTNKKHYNKSYLFIAFIVVLILLIVGLIRFKDKTKDLPYKTTQIVLNNENITANLEDKIVIEDDQIYMSFQDVKNFLDSTLYNEEETGIVITISNKKLATLKVDEENITINGSKQKVKNALIQRDNKLYLAISELQNVYDYEFKYIQESNVATIDNLNKKLVKAYSKKNLKVKEENKAFSPVVDKAKKGNWLILIEEEENIAKVRTQNGIVGYVKKKNIDNFVIERDDFDEKKEELSNENALEYDITKKDISTFEKRKNIIDIILQETIKNDKIHVKIIYNGEKDFNFERFKIEISPVLRECGITVDI